MGDTIELLPCPFCGKPAKWFGVNSIGCTDQVDCGASVDSGDSGARTAEFTLRSWQRRARDLREGGEG